MNKQQIQALIDAKIAGQGSAVDVGGALPTILHEILEAAFAGANVQSNWNETNSDSPQFIQNKPTIPAPYSLPTASPETLGGVKVGENLSIDPETGTLSAAGGGSAPLIVEIGHDEEGDFYYVKSGATFTEARDAFMAGRVVIAHYKNDDEDKNIYAIIYAYDAFENYLRAFNLLIENLAPSLP